MFCKAILKTSLDGLSKCINKIFTEQYIENPCIKEFEGVKANYKENKVWQKSCKAHLVDKTDHVLVVNDFRFSIFFNFLANPI